MTFENETLITSGLYCKNNAIENQSIFPDYMNYYGVSAFLLKSLEKIRNNASCDHLRASISGYINDYIQTIQDYHMVQAGNAEGDHPAFNPFAKTAYYKVLKEETDLQTLLGKISSMRSDEPDTFGILNNKNYGIPK